MLTLTTMLALAWLSAIAALIAVLIHAHVARAMQRRAAIKARIRQLTNRF